MQLLDSENFLWSALTHSPNPEDDRNHDPRGTDKWLEKSGQ